MVLFWIIYKFSHKIGRISKMLGQEKLDDF